MAEQRNPYRGSRAWLRLGFQIPGGAVLYLDLLADTGTPAGLMLRPDLMDLLRIWGDRDRPSTLGPLSGGWVRVYNPDFDGLVELVLAYGSTKAAEIAARSHPDFVGVVGLPLLRVGEYGGNATDFWFRYPPT